MTAPQIDKRITLGSIFATAASLVGLLATLFMGVFWIGGQGQTIGEHSKKIESNAAGIVQLGERVRSIETNSARQDERLLLILDSVRKIEAKLERGAP